MPRCLLVSVASAALFLSACSDESGSGGADGDPGDRGLVVATVSGEVQGFDNDGVYSFRGIPYAAPPVGDLRWAPPASVEPWTVTLDATSPGNICQQEAFGGLPIPGFSPSEDCLVLNVDTPAEGSSLPVMVWIHGGAFTLGEGLQADGGTAGDRIARQTGTVVVSMNYRLGQFGFLAHPALTEEGDVEASGNYGLMDQTAALRWVEENIAAFGGDPENVTIFGESAGAFSVCSHLVSPESAGLFDQAILQSGSCERRYLERSEAEVQGEVFADALGCADATDVLACMRDASASEVLSALPPAPNFGFTPTEGETGRWGPIVDGRFMVEQPSDSFSSGNFNQVPTIVGFTRGEARLFVWLAEIADDPLVVTEDNYEALVTFFLGGDADLAAQAIVQYPVGDFSEPAEALAEVATDIIFRCPAKQEAAKIAEVVPQTYLYQFEYLGARFQLEPFLFILGGELPDYGLDAFHSADIAYVFGYSPILDVDLSTFEATLNEWESGTTDEALWLDTLGYFTRFAATSDPNGDDAVAWPAYDPASDQHLVLDAPIAAGSNAADLCESFWNGTTYLDAPL